MKTEIYKDEGYRLMGAAFEVHNVQGSGMAEEIYHLINYGAKGGLEWKRFILSELIAQENN